MKIERTEIEKMTIQEFAERNDLTMVIEERNVLANSSSRYSAQFKYSELRHGGCMLKSAYGCGPTEDRAIENCAKEIDCGMLILHAMDKSKRREIQVPRLIIGGKI